MSDTRPAVTVQDGDRIRELRERRLKINRSQLAKRLGIKPQSLQNIEDGRRSPSIQLLVRIAQELNESVDGLLRQPPATAGPADEEPEPTYADEDEGRAAA